jgi:hypothetical protein
LRAVALRVSLALVIVALLRAFDPATTWWFPSCPLFALTGLLCPFCGSLRALHALLHGSLALALAFNPLATVGVPMAAGAFLYDTVKPTRPRLVARLAGLCLSARGLAFAAVFGLLRNLPATIGRLIR